MSNTLTTLAFFMYCWLGGIQYVNTDWFISKRSNDGDESCIEGFRCHSGKCIPLEQRCDGKRWDCEGNEDQLNCDSCNGDAFYCVADRRCIPGHWRCDGYRGCPSKEDEDDCPCEFKCEADNICIRKNHVCDGYPRCSDGQDEEGCTCSGHICNNKQCLNSSTEEVRCDGNRSCYDGSDEKNCDSCKNGAIHCSVDQKCIPLTWKCNGYFDCPSGEDEENCNSPNQVELLPII